MGDLYQFEQEIQGTGQDTLVIFDVDDTLIIPHDFILQPRGECLRQKYLKELASTLPPHKGAELISSILLQRKIQLVNEKFPTLIQLLHNRSIKTIALTAMKTGPFGSIPNQEDWRIAELRQMNLNFSQAFPSYPLIVFEGIQTKDSLPVFKEGILFSASHTKGEVLKEFLTTIDWKPQRIIFIDNRLKFLCSVQEAAESMDIPFKGFHYLEAEAFSNEITEMHVDFQLRQFIESGHWLSDTEAAELFNKICLP